MRVACVVELSREQEAELNHLVRSKLTSVRLSQRARIVLLAAQGLQNKAIAQQLGVGRVQVSRWRERYVQSGREGIERDLPRGAPPVKVDVPKRVELTTQTKPKAATHWSTRKMAAELGGQRQHGHAALASPWSEAPPRERLQSLARPEVRREARRRRGAVHGAARTRAGVVL